MMMQQSEIPDGNKGRAEHPCHRSHVRQAEESSVILREEERMLGNYNGKVPKYRLRDT
jgi:hypothetical protein